MVGVTPPRPAQLLRELMHMGQFIQSHSMHFFELAGPDLLLGFDADPAIRNVVGVIQANPELALKAVRLRAFGQDIIRKLGGKRIHPIHSIPGGVNAPLSVKDRDEILSQIDEMMEMVKIAITVAKGWYEGNMDVVNKFAVFPSGYMGMVDEQGGCSCTTACFVWWTRPGRNWRNSIPRITWTILANMWRTGPI